MWWVLPTSDYYDPGREGGFAFNDPEVGIEWPRDLELTASPRDTAAPSLAAIRPSLRFDRSPAD